MTSKYTPQKATVPGASFLEAFSIWAVSKPSAIICWQLNWKPVNEGNSSEWSPLWCFCQISMKITHVHIYTRGGFWSESVCISFYLLLVCVHSLFWSSSRCFLNNLVQSQCCFSSDSSCSFYETSFTLSQHLQTPFLSKTFLHSPIHLGFLLIFLFVLFLRLGFNVFSQSGSAL